MSDKHLAELLLNARLHAHKDAFRKAHPFAEDIEAVNAVLFSGGYDKRRKVRAYRKWLETPPNQPCVFGRVAAKNKNVFICLIEEQDVLRMPHGDEDLKSLIQDYRQVWKRHALDGLTSSFVILLTSPTLIGIEPGEQLKDICRRLLELYMEISPIPDDTFKTQREYVFLRNVVRNDKKDLLKFSTLPNIFCAQGDGRWWADHRTPGGIMITSNALGHFMYSRSGNRSLDDAAKSSALEMAMRTISNAYRPPKGKSGQMRHCPATFLVPGEPHETSPLKATSDFKSFSADHYKGYFHTDHLVPSVFFSREQDPRELHLYEDLSLRYIFDEHIDPADHAELMTGAPATMFEVKRGMDRLPPFADPDSTSTLPLPFRARLARWLEQRMSDLLDG